METEYSKYEPIFGSYKISKLLGEGSYGKVYEIVRQDFGVTYKAALKVITIPKSQAEVKNAMSEGMDEATVATYFRSFVEEMTKEFALMDKLKGNSYIVNYEDHTVIEHKGSIGWDVLIRMELLTPLTDYIAEKPLPLEEVVRLGIDLCKALEICDSYSIIHRDIKPENIFVSNLGNFKLGDFGIARVAEKTTGASTKVGTYAYMAPEILKQEKYSSKIDQYSLGLVLYRLLNNNRLPFLPPAPQPISYSQREAADARRIQGDPIPAPVRADEELSRIILKATAFDPDDRYSNPAQMRDDLERYLASVAPASAKEIIHTTGKLKMKQPVAQVPYERTVLMAEGDAQPTAQFGPAAQEPVAAPVTPLPVTQQSGFMQPLNVQQPIERNNSGLNAAPPRQFQKSRLLWLISIPVALLVLLVVLGIAGIFRTDSAEDPGIVYEPEDQVVPEDDNNKDKEEPEKDPDEGKESASSGNKSSDDVISFHNGENDSDVLELSDADLSDMQKGDIVTESNYFYVGDSAEMYFVTEKGNITESTIVLPNNTYVYVTDPNVISYSYEMLDLPVIMLHAVGAGSCDIVVTDGKSYSKKNIRVVDKRDFLTAGITDQEIENTFQNMLDEGFVSGDSLVVGYSKSGYVVIDIIGYMEKHGYTEVADKFREKQGSFMAYGYDYQFTTDYGMYDDEGLVIAITYNGEEVVKGNIVVLVMDPDKQDVYVRLEIPYRTVERLHGWGTSEPGTFLTLYADGTCALFTDYNASSELYDTIYYGTYSEISTGYTMNFGKSGNRPADSAVATVKDDTMTLETDSGATYKFVNSF